MYYCETRVCGAMRTNRGIPRGLEREAENMMKGQSFHRKGVILVQVSKDKWVVHMIVQFMSQIWWIWERWRNQKSCHSWVRLRWNAAWAQTGPSRQSGNFNEHNRKNSCNQSTVMQQGNVRFVLHTEIAVTWGTFANSAVCRLYKGFCFGRFHPVKHYWTTYMHISYKSAPEHNFKLQYISKGTPFLKKLST
jgi:hypothetical protein